MNEKSIWLKDVKFKKLNALNEDKKVDVLIIGGGITGLSVAYNLKESNLNICIVDKNKIAHGISARTTGKLTYLQDNIYTKLKDKSKLYYESQKEAIMLVKKIIDDNNINCNYEAVESYIFTTKESEKNKIKKEENFLKKLGINYSKHIKLPINLKCIYAISVKDTAVFHPLKYLSSLEEIILKNDINIYEDSCVKKIKKENDKYVCYVNNNKILADKVVVASHYPFFLLPFFFPIRTYIEKSYISASFIDNNKYFSAISLSKPIESIRYYNNYFIYLTATHNLCNEYNLKKNFEYLNKNISELGLTSEFTWSNHDIITEDNLPYIGYIDDNLLLATGYNTWGMTNGSLAGKVIADLILTNNSKYKELFDPKRNKKFNILKYPLDLSYSMKSIIENKVIKNKLWYKNLIFKKINGKNVAIYKDNNDHIVYNKCPHMKCNLIFNEVEKTWDCPCHGSRFDIDGKCIIGPSNDDIRYK